MGNKKNYLLLMVFFMNTVFSQVGIGTANPRGALDVNKGTANNMGLVLPTNADPKNLVNPMGGDVAVGTIMYDSTLSCVRVFKPTGWSNCLCDQCGPTPGFTLDCSSGALSGTFTAGTAGAGSKVINYTNATGQSYGAISIASTGVTGLTATAPAGTLATGNGSLTLAITGTPSSSGTASFVVTIAGQTCTFNVQVNGSSPSFTLDCASGALSGTFAAGTPATGSKAINYSNATGQSYGAISIASTGVTGLTATAPAGTLANGNGSITLAITGTPSSTGTANFTLSLAGQTCTFSVTIQSSLRTIRVLSFIPDSWNANLSNGVYSQVARAKMNNPANFGPFGTVKVANFSYSTINVSSASAAEIGAAIDNADIIWIGYIATGYLPENSDKRQILEQKIADKKKFFFIGNDNYNGSFFPAKTSFAGSTYDYFEFGTRQIFIIGGGLANGIFGNVSPGATIQQSRAIGKMTQYSGTPFLRNPDGSVNAVEGDNYVIVGDTNWYTSNETTDGFYNGTPSCSENNSSVIFCNIVEKGVKYILAH
ncbi:hypothetical protein [Chryseobacterium gallinarum]|uniref:Uncharacterized protein n=1 Tax=Chryseobacterium gallinarum TaxID=1324352 RepID=A0ABX6KRW2_CHRGL|nr:hypothetical protein [Chryseobacterium gallinarum]QIY91357.1 hypothetical protein FOB44_12225 [Chryseobacterium gallinarum]